MAIEEDEDPGIPEWVVTFGDMMSLLLTFFIMLVSLSEMKKDEKFQAMVESFREQFGYDSSNASLSPGQFTPRTAELAQLASAGRSRRLDLMNGGDKVKAPVGDFPHVRIVRPGKQVTTGTVVFFPEHKAELTPTARSDLEIESSEIRGKPQKIEVRGHTTPRPVAADSPFRDNWDLAYARARAVKIYLVSLGVDPNRIRVSVAADQEPIYDGTDQEKLKQNARVEVFLLDELAPVDPKGTKPKVAPEKVSTDEPTDATVGEN